MYYFFLQKSEYNLWWKIDMLLITSEGPLGGKLHVMCT